MPSTYVYCIVQSTRPPRTARVPPGLPGTGRIRAIDVGTGLFAIVADAPAARYSEAAVNAGLSDLNWVSRVAVRHEAVVEHFIDAAAVLPMKLFTIFADDDRMQEHMRGERSRLLAMARRVAGHQEWGVRVLLDRAKRIAKATGGKRSRAGALTGSDYLSKKKAARDASAELASQRARNRRRSLRSPGRAARNCRGADRPPNCQRRVGRCCWTRPSSCRGRRRRRSAPPRAERARALAPQGYAVTLTGPWPPYTFVKD